MNGKKQKRKASRRALKYVERAWTAVESSNSDLASKEIRRALQERQDNPVIWNDFGLILMLREQFRDAETAFRNAILFAPTYAEAYANLARLLARTGRTIQAERMQRPATELDPKNSLFQQDLELYQALSSDERESQPSKTWELTPQSRFKTDFRDEDDARQDRYDWGSVANELTARGYSVLPELLRPEECQSVRSKFDDMFLFEKSVSLGGRAGRGGKYCFYRKPIPETIRSLRASVYARVVQILNDWEERLARSNRFPPFHGEFLARCAEAGQSRSTPLLLRYEAPAVNLPHRDISGDIIFPVQLAVTLSARETEESAGCYGGNFFLADVDATGSLPRQTIATDLDDAILFCTRDRLVRVAGRWALQPVAHGMESLTKGERYVLGLPFHSYKGPR